MFKDQGVIPPLKILGKDAASSETLSIIHHDEPVVYVSSEDEILLMIQAAEGFINNDYKSVSLQPNSCYKLARAVLDDLLIRHMEQDKEKASTLVIFLHNKIQKTRRNLQFNHVLVHYQTFAISTMSQEKV